MRATLRPLPPGLEAGTYATLIEAAAAAGVPAVLDTHGEALRRGAAAGPAIVKPNLAELAALAGRPLASAADGAADGPADGPAASQSDNAQKGTTSPDRPLPAARLARRRGH